MTGETMVKKARDDGNHDTRYRLLWQSTNDAGVEERN